MSPPIPPQILLIIDLQKGFIRNPELEKLSSRIVELSRSDQFDYVIATKFTNHSKSPFASFLNWRKMMISPETDLVDGLRADSVVNKDGYNCVNKVFEAALDRITFGQKPPEIYICGLDTDCCILVSSVALFERGIRPIVLSLHKFHTTKEKVWGSMRGSLMRNGIYTAW